MPDTPLTEADLARIERYFAGTSLRYKCPIVSDPTAVAGPEDVTRADVKALVKEVRSLRADLEQAAELIESFIRDGSQSYYDRITTEARNWLKRVREREGKNG